MRKQSLILISLLAFAFALVYADVPYPPPIRTGTGSPSASANNGDMYLDRVGLFLYGPMSTGTWPLPAVSFQGSQGIQGVQGVPGTTGSTGPQGIQGTSGTFPARVFTNNPSRSIVTSGTNANGFLCSLTRDTFASYSASISVTATIGGASVGYVVLEICATNSATLANWQEISRSANGQTITLAVALQCIQLSSGAVSGIIPAGYYARIRSVNVSGTPSYQFLSGQEVQE